MLLQQEVPADAHRSIHHDLRRVHSVEDFIQSAFGRVLEVEDQREDELMVDEAEDASGDGLHVLREGVPAIRREPVHLAPIDPDNPAVLDRAAGDLGREAHEEGDNDDGDIDRHGYHADH